MSESTVTGIAPQKTIGEVLAEKDQEISRLIAEVNALQQAIRGNPCLTLVAQEAPFKDCFPSEPCEPCHCGKSLLPDATDSGREESDGIK